MYFPENIKELEQTKQTCIQLVNKRAMLSGVVAVVPFPGVAISVDIALIIELLTEISQRFGLSEEQLLQMDLERQKVLFVIIASVGNELAGRTISAHMVRSFWKQICNRFIRKQASHLVPLVGQAISAGISFATMRYLGHYYVEQCYQVIFRYMNYTDCRFSSDIIDILCDKE